MRRKRITSSTLVLFSIALVAACLLTGAGFNKSNPITAASEVNRTYEKAVTEYTSSRMNTRVVGSIAKETKDKIKSETELIEVEEATYTDEDLDLLSSIMYAEVGCSWIPDEVQLYAGSVVLNRVKSPLFPNTLYDVIYQEGQYSPTWNGSINNEPDERTIANAKKLLEEGSVLPENVVFQANFVQGSGVHYSYYDETLGTTTYFCYGNS